MRERPWPITTAAILLALLGWLSLLSVSLAVGAYPIYFFRSLYSIFGLSIIADVIASLGLSFVIYKMQRWSYFCFWTLNAVLTIHLVAQGWTSKQEAFKLFFSIWTVGQMIVSLYLITPNIRVVYFNPRLRWWETSPRYKINLGGRIQHGERIIDCELIDISEGGTFISSTKSLVEGTIVKITFTLLGLSFELEGKILEQRGENSLNYAITFVHTQSKDIRRIQRLCRGLGYIGVVPRTPATPTFKRIKHWAKEF